MLIIDTLEKTSERHGSQWTGRTDQGEIVSIYYFNGRLRVEEGTRIHAFISLPNDHPGRSHPGKNYDTISNAGLKQALPLINPPISITF